MFERMSCRYPLIISLHVCILTCTFHCNLTLQSCNPSSFSLTRLVLSVSSASYSLPRHSWLSVSHCPLNPRPNIHFRFSWPQSVGQANGSNTPCRVLMEGNKCFEHRSWTTWQFCGGPVVMIQAQLRDTHVKNSHPKLVKESSQFRYSTCRI